MKAIIFLIALLFLSKAEAGITIAEYQKAKNLPEVMEVFKSYLGGAGAGLMVANVVLVRRNELPLYCQPGALAMGADTYLNIIDGQLKKYPNNPADTDIVIVLISGLAEIFPCKM